MHHSDNTKGTSSYPFILEHLCIQTLSDLKPQNCFHLHASRAGSLGEILWYTAGRWAEKLFVWQFWLKGSYLWNALSVVALTLRLWVKKQCQKPVTSEEGLCRRRNVPNTSHIIRGFLKSEQAWESDREKPSIGWARGGMSWNAEVNSGCPLSSPMDSLLGLCLYALPIELHFLWTVNPGQVYCSSLCCFK